MINNLSPVYPAFDKTKVKELTVRDVIPGLDSLTNEEGEQVYTLAELAAQHGFPFAAIKVIDADAPQIDGEVLRRGTVIEVLGELVLSTDKFEAIDRGELSCVYIHLKAWQLF